MEILRLSALPDEIAKGFYGRVQRLNGWVSERDSLRSLCRWAASEHQSDDQLCLIEMLAMVAGIEIKSFVRDHSTLPFARAVVVKKVDVLHGSPGHRKLLQMRAMCDLRPGVFFCQECVKEDLDFHGAPYWRRSHQLPGAFWCQKHGCGLSVARSVRALQSLPTDFLEDCEQVSSEWVQELKSCGAIRNFLAISSDLLTRSVPLDELHVSRAVRARCSELEGHTNLDSSQSQLRVKELIETKFEKRWLGQLASHVGRKPDQFWKTMDRSIGGTRAGINSVGYTLIFAALYESADEAVNAMVTSPKMFAISASKSATQFPDEETMRAAYISGQGSHVNMANLLEISRKQVKTRMRSLGLPPVGRNDFEKIQEVVQELLEGKTTLSEACNKRGLKLGDMRHRLGDALSPFMSSLNQLKSQASKQRSIKSRLPTRGKRTRPKAIP